MRVARGFPSDRKDEAHVLDSHQCMSRLVREISSILAQKFVGERAVQ